MNKSKARGTAWESAIVAYLNDCGFPAVERRTLAGVQDKGDIAGLPGVVIEAKNEASFDLARYVREAETERDNAGGWLGFAWAKRRGRSSPADGYVVMTGAQLCTILRVLRKVDVL